MIPRPPKTFSILSTLLLLIAGVGAAWADGPGNLKFDEDSFEVLEEAGMVTIVVERSQGEDGAVSVDYATADGSATAGADYSATSGTLSWGAGDESNRSFTIAIQDDAEAEGAETIQLTLSNPTGGAGIDAERGTSVVVILASDDGSGGDGPGDGEDDDGEDDGEDDDGEDDEGEDDGEDDGGSAGIFKFDQRDFLTVEGAGVAVVSVDRSKGEDGAASVDYSTADGTATAGADYTAASGTLTWAPGEESSKVFTVPIANDAIEEGSETVTLTLSNPTGGAGLDPARSTAMLTILDDDQGNGVPAPGDDERPGTLKFGSATFQVLESGTTATILVERSRGEGGTVSVQYATADGSATAGADYGAASGVLTWGPGDGGTKSFTVDVFQDDLVEGNESVQLTLAAPTGGAGIDAVRGTALLTILDDDGSTAACTPSGTTLCLAGGRFEIEVDWRSPQGGVGPGRMIPSSDLSGLVWFFSQTNVEMLIKVIDACGAFDHYWVFFAATTNVDFTVTVTDTATGIVKQYSNPMGMAAQPVQDTLTFEGCP